MIPNLGSFSKVMNVCRVWIMEWYDRCIVWAQVEYDPKECSYESLLDAFFAQTDPTTTNQQGNDMGTQYRSGIYYYNDAQKAIGEQVS